MNNVLSSFIIFKVLLTNSLPVPSSAFNLKKMMINDRRKIIKKKIYNNISLKLFGVLYKIIFKYLVSIGSIKILIYYF